MVTKHLITPVNFGYVEENLYRSGQPTELTYPFLETLKLKHIIFLSAEEPEFSFKEFVEDHNITFHHLGLDSTSNAWDPITEEVVIKSLDLLLDKTKYPMLVMCNLGRHRTGTVIGCLRKVQRWCIASIFEEYRRYNGQKTRLLNEQFIELFDNDLVIIPNRSLCPDWL